MENTKLPVDNAALDAAYIENEPDEFITDMTDSHNGIDTADSCMKITLSVSADSDTSDAVGTRIDKFLSENLRDFSRSYLQTLIQDGNVTVNGKNVKSNYKLNEMCIRDSGSCITD